MLVNEHKPRYFAAGKLDKPKVAREVMIMWRKQEPAGRFLIKDPETKLWNDVGDQKAREKASQCLRERRTPCDVLPFRIPDQSGSAGKFYEGLVPSVKDVEDAATSGLLGSDAYEEDEVNYDDLPGLQVQQAMSMPNGFPPLMAQQQEAMRDKLQQEMLAQQEQLLLLQQQQMQMEQLHIQQQQLAQMSPDMSSMALQRHEEILRSMQYELKRQQDELEKQQQGLLESMQATAQYINSAATLAPEPQLSQTGLSSRTSSNLSPRNSSLLNCRSSASRRRGSGGKRRAEDNDDELKSDLPDNVPSQRTKPVPPRQSANRSGYMRMMAAPAEDDWDENDMSGDFNLVSQTMGANMKLMRDSYKGHAPAGTSFLNNMHEKYGIMQNPHEVEPTTKQQSAKSMEFEDLKDWAAISSRNVPQSKRKTHAENRARINQGVDFVPEVATSSIGDKFPDGVSGISERSSIMDWKSMRSVTSSKLEQTLEHLAKEMGASPSNSFRAIMAPPQDNRAYQDVIAPLGLENTKTDDISWAVDKRGHNASQNSFRRSKMKTMKSSGAGTSTISMMSELTDLSADMHALDLAIDD